MNRTLLVLIGILAALLTAAGCSSTPALSSTEIQKAPEDKELNDKIIKLRQQLKDNDPEVRRSAVWTLGYLGAKEAIPDVIKLLQDNAPKVRHSAITVLSNFVAKEAIPGITRLLLDNEFWIRMDAVSALDKLNARDAIPEIAKLLKDSHPWVRRETINALSSFGAKEYVPEIMELLNDSDWDVVATALKALVKFDAKESIPQIEELLAIRIGHTFIGIALDTLVKLDAQESIPQITELLNDGNSWFSGHAAIALVELGAKDKVTPEAIENVKLILEWDTTGRSLAALKQLGVPEKKMKVVRDPNEEIKKLIAKLKDPAYCVDAATTLWNLKARQALPDLLSHPEAKVRVIAIYLLIDLPNKEGAPKAIELLSDPDAEVRKVAAFAIRMLDATEAIPKLKKLLNDEDESVGKAAETALRSLGVSDSEIQEAKEERK